MSERESSEHHWAGDSEEFDRLFGEVLILAETIIWDANVALDEGLLKDVRRDSMPQIAVWRLHLGATSAFLGVIQCLKTRYSSLGAYSLLRGMIEAWTHLYFISDESETGTSALRAIRFEAGVLNEWASVEKQINPKIDYDGIVNRNRKTIMEMWIENGGTNEPKRRTYNDVNRTLQKMARSPALKQMNVIHSAASVAVHMSASDFLLESRETSVTVTWASPGRRCAWLQLGIMVFDYLTMSALTSVSKPENDVVIRDLHLRWQEVYNNPLLVGAVAAEGDSERNHAS